MQEYIEKARKITNKVVFTVGLLVIGIIIGMSVETRIMAPVTVTFGNTGAQAASLDNLFDEATATAHTATKQKAVKHTKAGGKHAVNH